MKNIVLFASGSGSNAENIILHFRQNKTARVTAVFCNNLNAGVIAKAENLDIPVVLFSKSELNEAIVLHKLQVFRPDLIVLAGFLLKFPDNIIGNYPNKIINIHPALLPKYGGKGMYGMNVHNAILQNKDIETGISIHYVNEHYDEGGLIFQAKIGIEDCVSAEAIALRIHQLEKEHFPIQIEKLLK
ncbi:MAG: phosphoribosylglycinamide formyltransferase [Flavobacterium sp.]|nr:phosphoribosylglycinamide formyltransferase [Flavobacterium sp.]